MLRRRLPRWEQTFFYPLAFCARGYLPSVTRLLAAIAADFDDLTAADFEWDEGYATGSKRLWELCEELTSYRDIRLSGPIMFRLMERLTETDLGSPGPLVHKLEDLVGYEEDLAASVQRQPVPHTLWMVNRILNSNPTDKERWLAVLRSATTHPHATASARAVAEGFLHQQGSAGPPP